MSFLSFIFENGHYPTDPEKIWAVSEWPTPSDHKQLHHFLGFPNFYRRFVRNYSKIAAQLTQLTSFVRTFTCTTEADKAFGELKLLFSYTSLLSHPDPSKQFILEVDASDLGVGAVLSQSSDIDHKTHLYFFFFSKPLLSSEKNYDVGNRELQAVKLVLEEWRHWLEGAEKPFIWIDHINLAYLQNLKGLTLDKLAGHFFCSIQLYHYLQARFKECKTRCSPSLIFELQHA